jgi:SAM-dependent methyltransferase
VPEPLAQNKLDEIAEAERAVQSFPQRKPFTATWGSEPWVGWATVMHALERLAPRWTERGQPKLLDVGCGIGWTSLFLAEGGFDVLGVDLAPAYIEAARDRGERWNSSARFEVADMDHLDLGEERFDVALVFHALHHSEAQADVVAGIARHLIPGGWVLFCEPSWLHGFSPRARRTTKETGWIERGIPVSKLKRDCRAAGLGDFERFFEGTRPYQGRVRGFGWQLVRLVAANAWVAPQAPMCLAAQRPD